MFVFEGSLQKETQLSITVLSCFWAVKDLDKYQKIFAKYWPSNPYFYIAEKLGITPEIARDSYVVDAVRIGKMKNEKIKPDIKRNRDLLQEEIVIVIKPDLLVLVGGTAERIAGSKIFDKKKTISVPFPTIRRNKEQIEKAEKEYKKLREKLRLEEY